MKSLFKRLLSVGLSACLMLGCASFAFAANGTTFTDTETGLHFEVTGDNTVAVISSTETSVSPSTYSGDISIPDKVTYNGTEYTVTEIGHIAFENSSVGKVTIPSSVTKIADNAFMQSSVTEIVFQGEGLTEIGGAAFQECASLTTITLPNTITAIGSNAFSQCSTLESLVIPAKVTDNIVDALGGYPHLDKVTFAEGSPYVIEDGVLYKNTSDGWILECLIDKSKTEVTVKDGITEIPAQAFQSPALTSVTLPSSVTTIGDSAFMYSSIATIDLTNVTSIGNTAFKECAALETVAWPTNLQSLGTNAFRSCTKLKDIEIQGSITEIPDNAFIGCVAVESVTLAEGLESIGDYAFDFVTPKKPFTNDNPQLNYINIPASVKSLGVYFLGGVKADGATVLIFQGTDLPEFVEDKYGDALSDISGKDINSPAVYYPAAAKATYEASDSALVTAGLISTGDTTHAYALTLTNATLKAGTDATFTNDVPTGCTLTVTSSDENIAKAEKGDDGETITVTGVAPGSATVTAKITLNSVGYVLAEATATVTVVGENAQAVPAVEEPKVDVDSKITDETQKTAAKTAAKSVKADDTLAAAAMTEANGISAKEAEKLKNQATTGDDALNAEGKEVTLYAQTYLDITATEVKTDGSSNVNEITLNITPMVQIVASTASQPQDVKLPAEPGDSSGSGGTGDTPNAVVVQEAKKLTINTPSEITVKLPDSFKSKDVFIKHVKESTGKTYYYKGTADGDGNLTFTSQYGFSPFTFSLVNGAAAELGDVGYGSFQDAVDAAQDGDTVKVNGDGDGASTSFNATMTHGGYRTITVENGTGSSITVTIDGVTKTIADGKSEKFTYARPARDSITVRYLGGNDFSTSKSAKPTKVEIDGVSVPFYGDGNRFSVSSISPNARWITVHWGSTSVTVNFTPDGQSFSSVIIPKTGDMSALGMALASLLGAGAALIRRKRR